MNVPTRDNLRKQKVPVIRYNLVTGNIIGGLKVPGDAVDSQADLRNNIAVKVFEWDEDDPYFLRDRYVDIQSTDHPVRLKTPVEQGNNRMKDLREKARQQLNKSITQITEEVIGEIPEAERIAFGSKEDAARNYQQGLRIPEDIGMFQQEIADTGESIEELVTNILGKAAVQKQIVGAISGARRMVNKKLREAQTPQDIQAAMVPLANLPQKLQAIFDQLN